MFHARRPCLEIVFGILGIAVATAAQSAPNGRADDAAVYDPDGYSGRKGWFTVGGTLLASPIIAVVYALCLVLAGCGPAETVTTAAIGAKMEADQAKQGQQLEAETRAKLDQAMQAGQANLRAAEQQAGD